MIIIDIFVAAQFLSLFSFFRRVKISKCEHLGQELSTGDKRAMWFTIVIFIMNINSSICRVLFCPYVGFKIQDDSNLVLLQVISMVMLHMIIPLTDMFTALGVLTLVYHMAANALKQALGTNNNQHTMGT